MENADKGKVVFVFLIFLIVTIITATIIIKTSATKEVPIEKDVVESDSGEISLRVAEKSESSGKVTLNVEEKGGS